MTNNSIIDSIKNDYLKKLVFFDIDKSIFPCFTKHKGEIIPIPLLYDNVIEAVKQKSSYDTIPSKDIIEGIVILLGCDSNFKFNKDYLEIIRSISLNLDGTLWHSGLAYMNKELYEISYIIFEFLLETYVDDNITNNFKYNQALCIYNLAIKSKDDTKRHELISLGIKLFEEVIPAENIIKNDYLGILYKMNKEYEKAYENLKYFVDNFDSAKDLEWFNYISRECATLHQIVQFEYGVFNLENYKHDKALTYFLPLEKDNPNWFALIFLIGKCYRALGKAEQALEYCMKALNLDETSADLYNEISLSYYMIGEIQKSKAYILKANELEKENIIFLINLCSIYIELNEIKKADEILKKALIIAPEDEVALQCRDIIQKKLKETSNGR